jgi:hypothetical protein
MGIAAKYLNLAPCPTYKLLYRNYFSQGEVVSTSVGLSSVSEGTQNVVLKIPIKHYDCGTIFLHFGRIQLFQCS